MFARILFPTDLTAYSYSVLACLPDLMSAGLCEVILLSVIRPSDVPMPETVNRDSLEFWRWDLEERLNIAKMALEGKGLRVLTRIEYGNPVEQIVRVADEEGVELIVLGAHGATATQELFYGSTAYEVIRHATVPVLLQKFKVIREQGHVKCSQVCKQTFQRVLHPTDFSEYADDAFQVVKHLKAAGVEEVVILHVQDKRVMKQHQPEQLAGVYKSENERMDELCKALRLFGLSARSVLRHGIPFKETLALADEMKASLIVLGSSGRSAVREMLVGSTFENVLRLSSQPVLVVRRETSLSDN